MEGSHPLIPPTLYAEEPSPGNHCRDEEAQRACASTLQSDRWWMARRWQAFAAEAGEQIPNAPQVTQALPRILSILSYSPSRT